MYFIIYNVYIILRGTEVAVDELDLSQTNT